MRPRVFLAFFVGLVVLSFVVPFLPFRSVPSFLASYLYWCVVTGGMLIFAAVYTAMWGRRS
jgi:hypothetical protein